MKLTYKDNKFVCETTYDERMIPKSAQFRWNPDAKCWWTDDENKAAKLIEYADDSTRARLEEVARLREEKLEASKATDADIEIPAPEGLEYMPFQKAGIAFAHKAVNALIGDQMGLGKSIEALGIINLDTSIRKVLLLCPASLKINWRNEAEKWLIRDFKIAVVNSKDGFPSNANFIILNYDIVKKYKQILDRIEFDIMIMDECHYLKNKKAQRTQLVFGKKKRIDGKLQWAIEPIKAKRKVAMTGTPITNRPAELFPIINALDPENWKSWWYYAKRYCAAGHNGYGYDFSGASNLEELQEKLRSTIMVRRLKKDVLKELPSKVRQIIEIPANGSMSIVNSEREAYRLHEEALEELKAKVELAKASDSEDEYADAVNKLRDASRIAFTEVSKLRHETAVAKIPYVVEHINSILEEENKLIVFAHHKDVISAIRDEFKNMSVVLTGDTKNEDRQVAVDRFQSDSNIKLFIGSITAAGVGITLTAASHVLFAELDWVPGNVSQCEDRSHRIGQQESVFIQHLVLEGSLDAHMAKTLVRKQDIIDRALDKDVDGFVKEPVIPTGGDSISEPKKKIWEEAELITEEEKILVHRALRALADRCNWAQSYDFKGFNKIDSRVGHSLAESFKLTNKQAVLGKKIIRKYRRQLESYGIDIQEIYDGNN